MVNVKSNKNIAGHAFNIVIWMYKKLAKQQHQKKKIIS